VHPPRGPAFSQGTVALLWAIALGGYVFLLMLGISVGTGVSLIVSIVCGLVIFFAVLLFGQDRPRRR
jgi:hypothetical protein